MRKAFKQIYHKIINGMKEISRNFSTKTNDAQSRKQKSVKRFENEKCENSQKHAFYI